MAQKISHIKHSSGDYERWSRTLHDFVHDYLLNKSLSPDAEQWNLPHEFANVLGNILLDARQSAQVRDEWKEQSYYINVNGLTVLMPSVRSQTSFNLGFEPDGFYLEAAPVYLRNLRYMGDDFWATVIGFCNQDSFRMRFAERPGSDFARAAREKLSNSKSQLFSLLRDYVLFELEETEVIRRFGTPAFATFGWYWPITIQWKELQQELPEIFKAFWKLDYQLWKPSYQFANQLKNRSKK